MKNKTARILEIPFSCCDFENMLEVMHQNIKNDEKGYINITNTESLYYAKRIPEHAEHINQAVYSCCDGIGVVLAGKLIGIDIPRLHGPDLMLKCCQYGVKKKWRHFFYGGKKGVPQLLSRQLTQKHPGLITAGTYSPPFRELTEKEEEEIILKINKSNSDILWVGLGLLKQERWIAEFKDNLNVPWLIGVGAAFDFHAGTIKRAPRFYREIGLEWLYRVVFEPRMLKRNLISLKLVLMIIWDGLKNRNLQFIG